ncbi:MAG: hypothetical protein LLG00_02515 [Planctomycetaceae bacterium]|nr:hypothetical protein [Planctomycetaceae bacterium]
MASLRESLSLQLPGRLRAAMASRTLRTISVFAGGNLVATALGVIGSVIQARYIGPEEMGVFRTFSIVVGYLSFLHLGTVDGLQRQLPYLMGRGNRDAAERVASASLAWTLLVSVVGAVAFLGLALWEALHGRWMNACGWVAYMPAVFAGLYGVGLGTAYRTGGDFARLSTINMAQAVLGTLLLPLLPPLRYFGLCLRIFLVSSFSTVLLHRSCPFGIRRGFGLKDLWGVLRVGFPLSVVGYVATSFWWSLESSIVLRYFGIEALGLFAVVVLFRQTVCQLVLNVNQVYMPRIAAQYGCSGRITECFRLSVKPMAMSALATLPLMAIGWMLVPTAVRLATPKYADAITAMQWTLPMMLVLVLRLPVYSLQASGQYVEHGISVACGIGSFAAAAVVAVRCGGGLVGIVVASTVGHVAQNVASYVFVYLRMRREQQAAAAAVAR